MEKGPPPPPYISLPPHLFSKEEDREEEKKMESGSLAKEGRGEWGGVDGGQKESRREGDVAEEISFFDQGMGFDIFRTFYGRLSNTKRQTLFSLT